MAIQRVSLITQKIVKEFLCNFFQGWDVSLATHRSILVLIRIKFWIHEFFTDFFATAVCKNFAWSAALEDVYGVRALLDLLFFFAGNPRATGHNESWQFMFNRSRRYQLGQWVCARWLGIDGIVLRVYVDFCPRWRVSRLVITLRRV